MSKHISSSAREIAPIDSIEPHPENYNRHDLDKIKASIKAHGQYRAVVVQASTRRILAGNGTYAAMRSLGMKDIAIELVDVDDEAARRILLVDNFAATDEYDTDAVVKILQELGGDLTGTGIAASDYDKMIAELNGGNADESGDKQLDEAYGFSVIVEADDEEHQRQLLEHFESEGLVCRAFTM